MTATVGLEPGEISVEGQLDEAASAESGDLVYRLEEREVTLKMSPPPGLALLSQAPQVLLACPVPAAVLAQFDSAVERGDGEVGGRTRVHREAIVVEID